MDYSIKEILDFWYEEEVSKKWFNSSPEFDQEIKDRFETLWQLGADNQLNDWNKSADGSLALCVLLDQFPLNMFRGEKKSFQTESQAIDVCKHAIKKGFDDEIEDGRVSFLYMPLMHSEDPADQALSVICFEKRALEDNLRYALHHQALIEEFGRFPHRNTVMNRKSSVEELDYLQSERAFMG